MEPQNGTSLVSVLQGLTVVSIRIFLRRLFLPVSGFKTDIIMCLRTALVDIHPDDASTPLPSKPPSNAVSSTEPERSVDPDESPLFLSITFLNRF